MENDFKGYTGVSCCEARQIRNNSCSAYSLCVRVVCHCKRPTDSHVPGVALNCFKRGDFVNKMCIISCRFVGYSRIVVACYDNISNLFGKLG